MNARNGHGFVEPAETLTTKELISQIAAEGSALVRKEMELAKAEITADVKRELKMVTAFGVAGLVAFCAVNMLFVVLALGLAEALPAWSAALIVFGLLVATAGVLALVGWKKRVRAPLERTRRHMKEDVKWLKHRFA